MFHIIDYVSALTYLKGPNSIVLHIVTYFYESIYLLLYYKKHNFLKFAFSWYYC